MVQDIYDPLTEYVEVFRDRFKEVAEATFAELAAEANVDIETNRGTCRKLYETEGTLSSVKTRIRRWKVWCVMLWIGVAGSIVAAFVMREELGPEILAGIGAADLAVIVYLIARVHPRLKRLKSEKGELEATADKFRQEAWGQMAKLNRLYDWDVLTRMMSRTVPRLEFDPYFTTQRLADLKMVYNWDDLFNAGRSVLYSHSGLINGNPFVICRTRKMEMGTKTYSGSKTITWTTRERGSDGKYHTVHHSQVLTATVTAPYPEYFEKTRLIYGNTAAPDLIFYRQQSGLAGKEDSLSFKWKKRSLRKKARNLTNADFAMMTNEEFEVAFNTSNRNNNQQFALLFTPLAQESMMKLLEDKEAGYGDDFDFGKNRMINTIISSHMQELNLDMNPAQYRHFDYNRAKADFYAINARYFRAIYFCLAPLLCVPMYQQIRPQHEIYGHDMQRHSAFWEHEALANFWGQEHFKHPNCVTDCILKTEQSRGNGDNSTITVYAHGYRSVRRLTYISKWGGDGRSHDVPVYWDEYFPVTGNGRIYMKEDNDFNDDSATHRQRLEHIDNVLGKSSLSVYRRHIASKV
ncbi:MAG: hypothetical protein NC308_07335 [Clostridium sp.]|nr:hypothetical protein [Bacteroides sp.]MCM1198685.1 hypothetical protein [Clostridium sp.]